jgi:hypothetical protein
MSTNIREQPKIEELLLSLDDDTIRRFHNSISISFKQMLAYIDNLKGPDFPANVNFLLNAYRTMAEKFYLLCELSILKEMIQQRDIKSQSWDAIQCIDGLHDGMPAKARLGAIETVLVDEHNRAEIRLERLKEDFPILMQNALDKLRDEWQRLDGILTAGRTLVKDEKVNRSIQAVGKVAAHFVGIDADWILIVPGSSFALFFFAYIESFAVLTVPVYSVHAPWEWSIFWHEIAGYKVRHFKKRTTIQKIKKRLSSIHELFKSRGREKLTSLLDSITFKNAYGRIYLENLLSQERLDLTDLGDFGHQFEIMMLNVVKTENLQSYDRIKVDGWCVDWFEELFEDAWSVLAIGEPFLDFFENVLGRNVSVDGRHPPTNVRLSVAKELLKLCDPKCQVENTPQFVELLAAEQILRFITLLMAASRKFQDPRHDRSVDPQMKAQGIRDILFARTQKEIQSSITKWSDDFLETDRPLIKVKNSAKRFLDIFSNDEITKLLQSLDDIETKQIRATYTALLKNKSYNQLLELSFYDADFGFSNVLNVFYGTKLFQREAKLKATPASVAGGRVKYENPVNVDHHTTFEDWNTAASPGSEIPDTFTH